MIVPPPPPRNRQEMLQQIKDLEKAAARYCLLGGMLIGAGVVTAIILAIALFYG